METRKMTLQEAEEREWEEEDLLTNAHVEVDEDLIILSGPWIRIPELGLYLREGLYCTYDADADEQLADFNLTAIYEDAGALPEPSEWDYWEQDDLCISLGNYLHATGRDASLWELYEQECELIAPEEV